MCRSRRELSNEYVIAKIGFDTAENKPCNFCPLSAYRSPRFHYEFVLSQSCDCPVFYRAPTQVRRAAPAAFRRPLRRCRASSITSRKPLERATFLFQIVPCSREKDKTFQNHYLVCGKHSFVSANIRHVPHYSLAEEIWKYKSRTATEGEAVKEMWDGQGRSKVIF